MSSVKNAIRGWFTRVEPQYRDNILAMFKKHLQTGDGFPSSVYEAFADEKIVDRETWKFTPEAMLYIEKMRLDDNKNLIFCS